MVKRQWVKRYEELPPASERFLTLQSWDTASKGGPDNDWSVCTTWIVTHETLLHGGCEARVGGGERSITRHGRRWLARDRAYD